MVGTEHADSTPSLVLDLRVLVGSEDQVERLYPSTTFKTGPRDDYTIAETVTVSLAIQKDEEILWLRGRIGTTMRLACCRCLEAFERPVNLEVDLRYLPQGKNTGDGDLEISDDDLSLAFYRDDQIDLGHLVREQLQLAAPMKPLCRDECRGLCAACGINRNTDQCSCKNMWPDPRLVLLRSLLQSEPESPRKD